MIVVSDTTPILSLVKLGRLDLLQALYGKVMLPEAVYHELVSNPAFVEEAKQVIASAFLTTVSVKIKSSVELLRKVSGLDAGESEAMILYEEQNAELLLMDERKGRTVAKKLDIAYIGTVGILMLAYDKLLLRASDVEECLDKLLRYDIRLGKNLCNKVLNYVGLKSKF